jgi:hypothetical protein
MGCICLSFVASEEGHFIDMVSSNLGKLLEYDLIIIPEEGFRGHFPRGFLALVYRHDEL